MALSWDENWQRSYKISIGARRFVKDQYNNNAVVGVLQDNVDRSEDDLVVPSNARVMANITSEDYDIRGFSFKFEGQVQAEENGSGSEKSTLTLYNLDEDMVNVINQPYCVVIIEAGYQDKTEVAYVGDVGHVNVDVRRTDMVYEIKCTSAGQSFRNSLVSLQYDESLSEKDIIIDMAKRFPGTALGSYGLEGYSNRFRSGGTNFHGKLHTEFNKLLTRNGLSWCVFNGKIVIIPYRLINYDLNKFNRTKYILPADNIKKITDKTDRSGERNDEQKSELKTLVINTFFLPAEVGQFIEIPDEEGVGKYAGTYLIKGRRLLLSSKGSGPWDTVFQVEQVV